MLGSEVLDVGIGLVLVFLLASIVMTAAQEGIEAVLQTRAVYLQQAVMELMQGNKEALAALYNHPLIFALYRGDPPQGLPPQAAQPGKGARSWWRKRLAPESSNLPAYIPREVFSAALIDMVQTGEQLPVRLRDAYDGLDRLTGGDVAQLRRELEGWYDGTMDRASGRFKKRTQQSLFFLGLAGAILLNINAVTIAQYLNANEAQRLLVVGAAEGVVQQASDKPRIKPLTPTEANMLHRQLQQIGLPIGWGESTRAWTWPWQYDAQARWWTVLAPIPTVLLVVAGWIITALATMLGAPFWFDVLNRLMVIRSTVKPKEKSPDEPSEDGGMTDQARITAQGGTQAVARGSGGNAAAGDGGSRPERDRAGSFQQPIYG